MFIIINIINNPIVMHLYGPSWSDLNKYIIIIMPTSTKPQAGKLGYTHKIMVVSAIYSVTMVLWKETTFPLCRAMERRRKRNVVSLMSSVIVLMSVPISCVSSMAISYHPPNG